MTAQAASTNKVRVRYTDTQADISKQRFLQLMGLCCADIKYYSADEVDDLEKEIRVYINYLDRNAQYTDMFRKSCLGKLNAINSSVVNYKRRSGGK